MRLPLLRLAFVFLALGACVGGRSAEIPGLRPAHPRLLATPDDWSRLAQRRAAEPDLSDLQDMTTGAVPIGTDERRHRLDRAQALMKQHGIGAVLIEPGSSLLYFTGIRWGRSERALLAVLPVEGEMSSG